LKLPIHPQVKKRLDAFRANPELSKLPLLGAGADRDEHVDAAITEDTPHEDLNTILDLLCKLHQAECLVQDEKKEPVYSQKEMDQITDELVEVITMLLDLRIPDASRRGRRIVEVAAYLGNRLGLDAKIMRELILAAKLRELGKAGLSDELLSKPRQMRTESEKNLYERYPVWGGIVLGGMPGLRGAANMIYHHLEKFDGTGHPNGLHGEAIPIGSRILHVAATFEVVTTDVDGSSKTAIEVLERGANREFDPYLVKLMSGYLQFAATPDWDSNFIRIPLTELEEGQILAEDLWTRSGVKLLPQGAKLTQHKVELILNYRSSDPIVETVAIYRQRNDK
ncbi:hypothetical protein KKB28_07155, partial [bacterium]|nr:hypothetical protein [bacterium]